MLLVGRCGALQWPEELQGLGPCELQEAAEAEAQLLALVAERQDLVEGVGEGPLVVVGDGPEGGAEGQGQLAVAEATRVEGVPAAEPMGGGLEGVERQQRRAPALEEKHFTEHPAG